MVLVGGANNKHPHTCTSVDNIPRHTWVVFFLRKRVEEDQGLVQPYLHLLWSNFNPMTSVSSKKTSTSTGIKSFNHPYSYESSETAPLRQNMTRARHIPSQSIAWGFPQPVMELILDWKWVQETNSPTKRWPNGLQIENFFVFSTKKKLVQGPRAFLLHLKHIRQHYHNLPSCVLQGQDAAVD